MTREQLIKVCEMRIERLRFKMGEARQRNDSKEIARLNEETDDALAELDKLTGDDK